MVRLISVRYSHFCEKARWALDRAKVPYTEDAHVPVLSWPRTYGVRGGRTVPVLVTPDGTISDSTDILRWVDRQGGVPPLFPDGALGDEVAALEDEADRRVGPATRRLAYHAMWSHRAFTKAFVLSAGPAWERHLGGAIFPALRALMQKGLKIDDAGAARSRAALDETFARIEARLADGRRYLAGDRFTAADLTFASLATPILLPDAYRNLLPDGSLPAEAAALVDGYRNTAAGRWVLDLYRRERLAST